MSREGKESGEEGRGEEGSEREKLFCYLYVGT
jgi:hypothetical protein